LTSLSLEDAEMLSSVKSVKNLNLSVKKRTTRPALSTMLFKNSTIKQLSLTIKIPLADTVSEFKVHKVLLFA
jgi:hypothetical protein